MPVIRVLPTFIFFSSSFILDLFYMQIKTNIGEKEKEKVLMYDILGQFILFIHHPDIMTFINEFLT